MKSSYRKSPQLVIRYNTRLRLLRLWRPARANGRQVSTQLNALLKAVGRRQARQLLLNMEQLPPLPPGLQKWLRYTWLPQLRQSSLVRLAVLLPSEALNRVLVEGLLLASVQHDLPYEVQYFPEPSAALDWLTDAELPSREQDWRCFWRTPTLVRGCQMRWRKQRRVQRP